MYRFINLFIYNTQMMKIELQLSKLFININLKITIILIYTKDIITYSLYAIHYTC